MKKFKSLISLLLVLGILLTMSAVPTYAAGRITVNGGAVAKVTPPGAGNYTNYGTMLLFGIGNKFDYTVTVPSDGQYHISLDAKFEKQPVLNITTPSGSLEVKDSSGTRREIYVGKFDFKEGDNTLNFSISNSGATVWLYNIYAEKASDKVETDFTRTEGAYKNYYIPTSIEAEDFDMGPNGSYSLGDMVNTEYRGDANFAVTNVNGANVVSVRQGEWLNYTFNVSDAGSYDMAVKTDSAGQLGFYFDDMQHPIVANPKGEGETHIANVYLEEGKHILKLVGAGTKLNVDYISFASASESGYRPEDLATIPQNDEAVAEKENDIRPIWKELWVDGLADVSGDGSKSSPFKTIEEAKNEVRKLRNSMQGDIVVKIMPGEYELEEKLKFSNEDGGINGYRVVYKGANMLEKPLISGGTRLSGWREHKNGVWTTAVSNLDDVRQLYINGYAAQRARSKYLYNFSYSWDDPEDTAYSIDGYGISKINFPVLSNGGDVEVIYNLLWCNQRVPVKEIRDDGKNWLLVFDQPYFGYMMTKYYDTTNPLLGNKCYLENAYELLDEPGEFYFDKTTKNIYYYPFPEEDMKTAETVVGRTEFMIEVLGESKDNRLQGLEFNNLDFRYGTWIDANRTGVSVFQADCILAEEMNSTIQSRGRTLPAQLEIDNARDIHIKNCNFQNLGSTAIGMTDYVNDSSIEGNVFRDLSGSAASIGSWRFNMRDGFTPADLCENIEVNNNVVRRVGNEYYGSVGFGVYYARNITLTHNDLATLPYSGFTVGWGWGSDIPKVLDSSHITVANNRIFDISKTVRDGGHIYNLGESVGTVFKENYCELSNDYGGIYMDSGSAMLTIHDNVMKDCMIDAIFGGRGTTGSTRSYGQNVYHNWSNRPQTMTKAWDESCGYYELPILVADNNWPSEAQAIIEKAGVERGYNRLLDGVEYPEWRTVFYETAPMSEYESVNIIDRAAIEYMEGGEGVAFHDNDSDKPREYKQGQGKVIGNTSKGEWINYEIDVKETGAYNFELCYALLFDGASNLDKSNSGVKVYVDNVEAVSEPNLASTGSWTAHKPIIIGEPINLTAGKHILKIEWTAGWSFEKFRLLITTLTETEPEFDDGVLLR